VDRVFAAQTFEIRLPGVVEVNLRITDVDPVQRYGCGVGLVVEANRSIHDLSP
jgi:hypothetical protein